MPSITVCHNCKDRHEACYDTCERYRAEHEAAEQRRAAIRKRKQIDKVLDDVAWKGKHL